MPKTTQRKRKYKLYRGGNTAQTQVAIPVQPQVPQQVQGQPVQMGVIPQAKPTPKNFPKKIRLNITSDFKSTIEAPQEAEYILSQRMNSQELYKIPDIYKPTFGKDETNDTPVDLYSEYVYERMKDLKLASCQELRNKGDKKTTSGFFIFKRDSTRRQQCTNDIKTLIRTDNKILQSWVNNFNQYGVKFLENVQLKVEELSEKIKDLEAQKKQKENDLQDAIQTLEQNKSGIARESDQRLTEILRIISDKEDNMVKKIDTEINDFNRFLKEEIGVVSQIQKFDQEIEAIVKQIKETTQQKQRIMNGLNKTNAQLQAQGLVLEKVIKKIEDSISRYALMAGGRRRKKAKKSKKKSNRKKRSKKKAIKGGSKDKTQKRLKVIESEYPKIKKRINEFMAIKNKSTGNDKVTARLKIENLKRLRENLQEEEKELKNPQYKKDKEIKKLREKINKIQNEIDSQDMDYPNAMKLIKQNKSAITQLKRKINELKGGGKLKRGKPVNSYNVAKFTQALKKKEAKTPKTREEIRKQYEKNEEELRKFALKMKIRGHR